MAKSGSGTKLVPPPRDFVPQGDFSFRNKVIKSVSSSSNVGNSSVEDEDTLFEQGDGTGVQQANGQHSASQNPLYKVL